MNPSKVSFIRSIFTLRFPIRAKFFALAAFVVLTLVFMTFYLQSVLNENARMTARQSDIIQALTDTSNANLQFGRFRWIYLTFLNQPNAKTAEPVGSNIQILKNQLYSLKNLSLDNKADILNSNIDSLQIIANTMARSKLPQQQTEAMTQNAMTALAHIDEILDSTGETLKTLLNEKSMESLQKTSGMRAIPIIFILGSLLVGFIAMSMIILDILVPINKISSAMSAASLDTENARNHTLPVDRNDEVGHIIQSLNHLLEAVSASADKIRQTENMLYHSQRMEMLGRMSGGIAHDFNNMLLVISGNLELIERRASDNVELKEMIRSALDSVEKGKELTQRMLVFSRKQILKPETVNLNEKIPDILELIRRAVREDVDIETDLQDGLWDVHVDQPQLESALLNLAINARDSIQGNDGKIVIRTRNLIVNEKDRFPRVSIEPGPYVVISVTDNGIGISEDILEIIFDPFFTTKEPGKGTGLGLSMVYGFTRQSGGYVTIDSEIGKGSTMSLFFPRSKEDFQEKLQKESLQSRPPEIIKGGRESLLVVEDRDDVLKYLSTNLRQLGYRVTTAKDGAAAIQRLQKRKNLDMLITDVVMPGNMNGEELAAEVRKKFPLTKVLYISGYTRNALIDQGVLKPGVHLLAKPFTTFELAHEVRNVLERQE